MAWLQSQRPETVNEKDLEQSFAKGWKNYRILSNIPELQLMRRKLGGLLNLRTIIGQINLNQQLSPADEQTHRGLQEGFVATVWNIDNALKEVRHRRARLEEVIVFEDMILDQTNRHASFLQVLRRRALKCGLSERDNPTRLLAKLIVIHSFSKHLLTGEERNSQEKILAALQHIQGVPNPGFQHLLRTDWTAVETELLKYGISQTLIEEEYLFIDTFLCGSHQTDQQEEDQLSSVSHGIEHATIAAGDQPLMQTTEMLSIHESASSVPRSHRVTLPSTFEHADGPLLDDEISRSIKKAVENEATQRFIQHEQDPSSLPHSYDWLPKPTIPQYRDSSDVIKMMDAASFSAMAYETVPRCSKEIARLTQLLQVSFDHKKGTSNDHIVERGLASLTIAAVALNKFILIQDQQNDAVLFSDLDALDFEHSTAVVDPDLDFPYEELNFAQKSYYSLLTYILGFVGAFSEIFPGRTYVAVNQELEIHWSDRKMDDRVAWVKQRLARWDEVEQAVSNCRNWHGSHTELLLQASAALKDWQKSEEILSGYQDVEVIDITLISASGLPRSNFMSPSAFAKLVFYGPNQFGGAIRIFDHKTDAAPRTQNPVWDKSFSVELPINSKMVDVEIYDRVAGMEKELCRTRIKSSFIPGVEATFANRSLMYGLDEEIEFTMYPAEGKSKQKEPMILKLGLKWKGRYGKVEALGLPTRAPGKMFREDILATGIPLSAAQKLARANALKPKVPEGGAVAGQKPNHDGVKAAAEVTSGVLGLIAALV